MLRNEIISSNESIHFLGMTLDRRSNWEEQIKSQSKESIKYSKISSRKEIRSDNPKKLYSAISRTKIDYTCQIYNTASAGRLKKLDSMHTEGIRIYTGDLKTSPVESLHVEANDPPWN